MNLPVRAVLDTNVVLSGLVFRGGAAGQLRLAWQRGRVLPLVSTATVQELIRVLAYPKFHLSQDEQDELLADYLPYAETVRIPQKLPWVTRPTGPHHGLDAIAGNPKHRTCQWPSLGFDTPTRRPSSGGVSGRVSPGCAKTLTPSPAGGAGWGVGLARVLRLAKRGRGVPERLSVIAIVFC